MISIDKVHELLPNFGITHPSDLYERRVKSDGFEEDDVIELLGESPFYFIIDWRFWLEDELEVISRALYRLDVNLEFNLNEDRTKGMLKVNTNEVEISCDSTENEGGFDLTMLAISKILPSNIEIRASVYNQGNDTCCYIILPKNHWEEVDDIAGDLISSNFYKFGI
ncbi:hypothetical protein [Acinetobacter haemolyticus]|uniref:hypothetical protein n=1 Tax=Acinetobacter haemolyticus TaxID=29430 RepID=UPI000DEB0298|nr:hypothetical protein [Acinetobacter haemolyticus]WHR58802.1 hypothetical protein PGW89_05010 [Acinetobacter haemolyticus]